ncbi:unnamed protein product, partial [Phaeothamnion confervicola]
MCRHRRVAGETISGRRDRLGDRIHARQQEKRPRGAGGAHLRLDHFRPLRFGRTAVVDREGMLLAAERADDNRRAPGDHLVEAGAHLRLGVGRPADILHQAHEQRAVVIALTRRKIAG